MEYYFTESFNLNDIENKAKALIVSFDDINKCARIYDKCGNYIKIDNVDSYSTEITTVIVRPLSGGEFVVHDICYLLQYMAFSEDTYADMADWMELHNCPDFSYEDKIIFDYITLDMNNNYLDIASDGHSILLLDNDACEEERKEAQERRLNKYSAVNEIKSDELKLLEKHKRRVAEIVSSKVKY